MLNERRPRTIDRTSASVACALRALSSLALLLAPVAAGAQESGLVSPDEAQRMAAEALADRDDGGSAGQEADTATSDAAAAASSTPQLNILDLLFQGGVLMIPIALMSLIVVAFSLERALALRRSKVIPPRFVRALGELARAPGGFDPRAAYRLCQESRSAAAEVVRSALLKVGRPLNEIEHAVSESCDREAARLYANVRPIYLAVTITPLLGLLGTVQGMIQAFFVTAESPLGVNKAQNLAAGIYVALVTTFAGLSVAIPAAIISHYFEGRIQRLFHLIDDLAQSLLPQLERFEGKLRTGRGELGYLVDSPAAATAGDSPMPPEIEPPPVRTTAEPPRPAVKPTEA